MENYKDRLNSLAGKLKTERIQAPLQEVNPVKVMPDQQVKEARFNNWIPIELKKRIKVYCANADISQKELSIAALEEYLINHASK